MKKSSKRVSAIYIIAAGICWGIIGVFSRGLSSQGFNSVQITASRCIITAVCLSGYLLIKDKQKLKIDRKDIWYFIGTGICSIVFFNICYFATIRLVTLSMASILLYTAPCFVMLMSATIFGEKITVQKAVALLIAFLGCVLTTGIVGNRSVTITTVGILTGIGSGIGYALYSIFGRIALKKYDSLTVTVYTFIVASISILPFCNIGRMFSLTIGQPDSIINALLLGIVSTLLPFLLYTKGLNHMEAGKASVMAFVEPMVATTVGIIVFKEQLGVQNSLGIVLIFVSVVLLNIKMGKYQEVRGVRLWDRTR